jgi:BASS family bile acid:Na+ symporter
MDVMAVLKSTAKLVLAPLCAGIALSGLYPKLPRRVPTAKLGIVALMVLCAGGSANSAASILGMSLWKSAVACSVLLPMLGGAGALLLANLLHVEEASKRTLVVEVLSKSPTLAYVIALRHFDAATAAVPSAAMVSLAILGALVASIWSRFAVRGE